LRFTTAVGGTIIMDTAALMVLAVVATSTRDALDAMFWVSLLPWPCTRRPSGDPAPSVVLPARTGATAVFACLGPESFLVIYPAEIMAPASVTVGETMLGAPR
jgi:hypothetical protein